MGRVGGNKQVWGELEGPQGDQGGRQSLRGDQGASRIHGRVWGADNILREDGKGKHDLQRDWGSRQVLQGIGGDWEGLVGSGRFGG